jgi:hypothetical protein
VPDARREAVHTAVSRRFAWLAVASSPASGWFYKGRSERVATARRAQARLIDVIPSKEVPPTRLCFARPRSRGCRVRDRIAHEVRPRLDEVLASIELWVTANGNVSKVSLLEVEHRRANGGSLRLSGYLPQSNRRLLRGVGCSVASRLVAHPLRADH